MILLATSVLKKQDIHNIAEAARVFNVPRTTLKRRLNGHVFRAEARANGHKMTQNEANTLVRWILLLDQRGAASSNQVHAYLPGLACSEEGRIGGVSTINAL